MKHLTTDEKAPGRKGGSKMGGWVGGGVCWCWWWRWAALTLLCAEELAEAMIKLNPHLASEFEK